MRDSLYLSQQHVGQRRVITRFRSLRVSIIALALSLGFVGAVNSQDDVQQAQLEALERYVPAVKIIRDFLRSTSDTLDRLKNALNHALTRTNPNHQSGSSAEPPEPPFDPQAERRLRDEFAAELSNAFRRQNSLVDTARAQFRSHASASLDKCKQSVAARDAAGARASCGTAEKTIDACTLHAREINEIAERLTTMHRLNRDQGSFATLYCPFVFGGLDDPRAILSKADFGQSDEACYKHAAHVETFARTGTPPIYGRIADYASVPAYLAWIRRNCSEKIADQAQRDVNAALNAKAEADKSKAESERKLTDEKAEAERKLALDEANRNKLDPPPEEPTVALPRRSGNSGAALLQSAIDQAANEERLREARAQAERQRLADEERRRQQPGPVVSRGEASGANPSSRYSSACERNSKKIDQVLLARGVMQYGASNDLFLRDVNLMGARLYQPCAPSNSSAADIHRNATAEADRISRYCAGPHRNFECTQWGYGSQAGANRNWYSVFSTEANKALSDPNYSVDLDGGATQPVSSNASGDCKAANDRHEAEFGAISQRIANTSSVIAQLQLLMGMLSKRMALLDQLCKGQPQYSAYAGTKQQYDSAMRNCRGLASNPSECGPNANPARDSQQGSTVPSGVSNQRTDDSCRFDANGAYVSGRTKAECVGNASPLTPSPPRRGNTIQ